MCGGTMMIRRLLCIASPLFINLILQQPRNTLSFHSKWLQTARRTFHVNSVSQQIIAYEITSTPELHGCKYCQQSFASRNAMFRHVRSNLECTNLFLAEGGNEAMDHVNRNAPRRGVALLVGYHHDNATAAITNAFRATQYGSTCTEFKISQASAVDHRHIALAQDLHCAAAGDVLTLKFRSTMEASKDLVQQLNLHLQNSADTSCIRVLGMDHLGSSHMNAEQDSTQIAYHYLVPVRWLPNGTATIQWWLQEEKQKTLLSEQDAKTKRIRFGAKRRNETPHSRAPPLTLKLWKDALKSASSRDNTRDDEQKTTRQRFRGLDKKEKRCWHNFADPALKGDASPNNVPVWRTLDRARTIYFFENHQANDNDDDDVLMVVELRGDGFVTQQVRRIIGSAIAMAHGWLPPDFFDTVIRPDVIIETPLAPAGNMYMAGARYDFNEIRREDILFNDSTGVQQKWMDELRDHLLSKGCHETRKTSEHAWLENLRDVVAPRIRTQLRQMAEGEERSEARRAGTALVNAKLVQGDSTEQHLCGDTMSLLRQIVQNGKWPSTSAARSKVIRAGDICTQKQSGSFTVVNPAIVDADNEHMPWPLANQLFPDLVTAVFALERAISVLSTSPVSKRRLSSHCAVNRNAEFTPHVDSGRGAGQSLSMIIGLGDYTGGGLMVEGVSHDVRYQALEFDGWKLRHWTEPFEGERYSLVWFTPEQTEK